MTHLNSAHWFCDGRKFFAEMVAAIESARQSVELEIYIFVNDVTGRRFLEALLVAARAGARVRVMVDSFGSFELPQHFFEPLVKAGGEVRFFNPLRFTRFGVRNHRKVLICDLNRVIIGGANISDQYEGDGGSRSFFDLMVVFHDRAIAEILRRDFEAIFANSDFEYGRLRRLRAFRKIRRRTHGTGVFSMIPGRGVGGFQHALEHHLARASNADIMVPYFLPPRRIVAEMKRIVKEGGRVRLIFPEHSDVPVARAAGLVYYQRLLEAGVEIYEYQAHLLHAKLYVVDNMVFAGSSNLDVRSLRLNYEVMLSFTDHDSLKAARKIFEGALLDSRKIELEAFRKSQNFFNMFAHRWAHFLLKRIDPYVALHQIQR